MMKALLAVLVVVDLFLIYLLVAPRFVDSYPMARAVATWIKKPSSETKQEVEHQQRLNDRFELALNGVIFCLIVATSYGVYRTWRVVQAPAATRQTPG
jgi:hypothetical protein